MDPTDIFHPVFNMFWLTIAVFLLATALRMKSIYLDKDSPGEDYRHPTFPQGNRLLQNEVDDVHAVEGAH